MTTFYDPVTPPNRALTRGAGAFDTTRVGEAMAPAPGSEKPPVDVTLVPALRRFFSRSEKIRLGVLILAVAACDSSRPSIGTPLGGPKPGTIADPGRDPPTAGGGATAFYTGLAADTLGGEVDLAAKSYDTALADPTLTAPIATRAALRWAALEAATGRNRHAIELLARAEALAEGDPVLTDSADRLQGAVTGLGRGEVGVRGPPLGTPIAGASPAAAARFARAEVLLARAHRLRLRPVFEALSSSLRAKERATEAAVRAFREVAATGPARLAADYRIGSVYHDLALALVFELPPELDPGVASRLRRTLRTRALGYLRKAVVAYRRVLEPSATGADLWRAAAQSDLRAALDLIGEP